MSTTQTATSPYPLFGTDSRLRVVEDHAKIMDGNLARPVTA